VSKSASKGWNNKSDKKKKTNKDKGKKKVQSKSNHSSSNKQSLISTTNKNQTHKDSSGKLSDSNTHFVSYKSTSQFFSLPLQIIKIL